MNHIVAVSLSAFAASFAIAFILYKIFIPMLRKVKLGQKILEIGPKWHKSKEGTPTMGGLFFITASMLVILGMYMAGEFRGMGMFLPINLCFMLMNGAIGFIDDYVKLFKKRNKGLTAIQKLVLQFAVTGGYLAALRGFDLIDTGLCLPFTDKYIELGALYYVIVAVMIVYIVNCANLTDGLDGLAGSVAFVIAALFFIIATREGLKDIYITSAAIGGALVAFLVFNFYPAKIFMGDTGSVFLGAMLVACVMRTGRPLMMLLVGFVYVVEGLSDIIQIGVYKLSHRTKRVFKMAPIHHHFELCGFSEVAIVAMFLGVTVAVSALAYYVYYAL